MKKVIKQISYIAILACVLTSFISVDFSKTLVGIWQLETIESTGQTPIKVKEILGDMFLEFKSDFTYLESGPDGKSKKGTWKITNGVYLQMKRDTQADFTEKEKLREISPDQLEMTHPDKNKYVFTRVK